MSKVREGLSGIRDLPDDELDRALDRAREELFRLRLGNYTNQVENTVSLRYKRRELARILTVQRGRELDLETQSAGGTRPAAVEAEAPEAEADDEPKTVAERARAAVGRPKASKGKASAKPAAKAAAKSAKPAAKATGKAKSGAKTSKKSGKE